MTRGARHGRSGAADSYRRAAAIGRARTAAAAAGTVTAAGWLGVAAGTVAAAGWLGGAAAQPLPPSAAELAAAALPVRVVCLADSADVFLRDSAFRDRVLVPRAGPGADGLPDPRTAIRPLGLRYLVPLGAGFVVDAERRHVVTSWQAVADCGGEPGTGRRLAVIEAGAAQGPPLAAERLPLRPLTDAGGQPVPLVQALCRAPGAACGAGLPRVAGEPQPTGVERRRQLDNLLTYAPDLAVLRLAAAAGTPALALALEQPLDDQMRLVVRAFGRGADALAPASVAALYTGPQQFSGPAGDRPGLAAVQAPLHRLAMPLQPDAGGAPVLRGAGVVGVLSVMLDRAPPASDASGLGTSHAVPVAVLARHLTRLNVPFQTVAQALPRAPTATTATTSTADSAQAAAPAAPGAHEDRRGMLFAGAGVALAVALGFFVLARRQRQAVAQVPGAGPAPPPAVATPEDAPGAAQRTVTRRRTTVLHAVAMPTAALEPAAPEAAQVVLRAAGGPLQGAVFTLPMPQGRGTLYLGRDGEACQVVFPPTEQAVSPVHACLTWDPPVRTLTLRDLSGGGTWVNGVRVERDRTLTLADGDQVDLGGPGINRFTIELASARGEPAR